jgi:hypothetical protein
MPKELNSSAAHITVRAGFPAYGLGFSAGRPMILVPMHVQMKCLITVIREPSPRAMRPVQRDWMVSSVGRSSRESLVA